MHQSESFLAEQLKNLISKIIVPKDYLEDLKSLNKIDNFLYDVHENFILQESSQEEVIEELKTKLQESGRAAWKKLFTEVKISDQLAQWEKEIPKYGCDCSNFYQGWKSANPPEENIGFTWKWRLKNAVNEKLNQPQLSLEEAKAFWANFGVNTDG